MFYRFLLLNLTCSEELNFYKWARFFREFKFIFSYVELMLRYDLKAFDKVQKISIEIRDIYQILVLFQYIAHVVLLTCSCRRLYSSKYFCPFPLSDLHFIEPHIFISSQNLFHFQLDQIQAAIEFNGSAFAHFSHFIKFRFSAFNISLLETLFCQGNKQARSVFFGLMYLHV